MGKNLVPEVCKLLGIEVGEKFKVKDVSSDYTTTGHYLIDEYGRVNICDDNGGCVCAKTAMSIDDFLTGKVYEIIKLPWKPKVGEEYYSFDGFTSANGKEIATIWGVYGDNWYNYPEEIALFEKGWIYKTEEEAKAALPQIAEALGIDYEL